MVIIPLNVMSPDNIVKKSKYTSAYNYLICGLFQTICIIVGIIFKLTLSVSVCYAQCFCILYLLRWDHS